MRTIAEKMVKIQTHGLLRTTFFFVYSDQTLELDEGANMSFLMPLCVLVIGTLLLIQQISKNASK